jgi:hypothetical protein
MIQKLYVIAGYLSVYTYKLIGNNKIGVTTLIHCIIITNTMTMMCIDVELQTKSPFSLMLISTCTLM